MIEMVKMVKAGTLLRMTPACLPDNATSALTQIQSALLTKAVERQTTR